MTGSRISAGRAPASARSNLPAHSTSLIGRDDEALTVRQRLMEAEAGLLTLTGAGGCGKTSLALHVALGLLDEFADGVWVAELAPLSEPALVDHAVAAALGVRERPGQSVRQSLMAFLRARVLLLVLDNCEHLVEVCAQLAQALLAGCPELRILATSREPLRTPGEVVWRVPSLKAPDPQRLPPANELAEYAAVRLFVERARAVRAGFALGPTNAHAVARVCARLDGMPLALELAAARTRAMGMAQIAARLDESFRLLVGGSRTAHSRQRTLAATLDWSYDLLTEAEQTLLCRLSVFAGGFDLDVAEIVCAGDGLEQADVLDVLTLLVDKSLVVVQEGAEEARYRLLEPIRQYARERLAARGEEATLRIRHAAHYLAVAERAYPALWGSGQAIWVERLEQDHDNLRAALAWLNRGGDEGEADAGRRLAVALSRFWHTRGDLSEGRKWIRRSLKAPRGAATPALAWALVWASTLAHAMGDFDEAETLGEESVAVSRELGDDLILGLALVGYGDNAVRPGKLERAVAMIEEGVAHVHAAGAHGLAGVGMGILGTALRLQGDLDGAAAALEDGLVLSRSIENIWGIALALQDLAQVALERGEDRRAAALFAECLTVACEIWDRRRIAECLEGFAELSVKAGVAERAAWLLGAAHALRESTGSSVEPVDRAVYDRSIADVRQVLGEPGFTAAWNAGRTAPLDEALADVVATSGTTNAAGAQPTQLTGEVQLSAREQEVVRLIARGLTNSQIGEQLVISRRTADRHVSNILNKLGLVTRVQIAAWALERVGAAARA